MRFPLGSFSLANRIAFWFSISSVPAYGSAPIVRMVLKLTVRRGSDQDNSRGWFNVLQGDVIHKLDDVRPVVLNES